MPKLVRLYITNVAIGFALSLVFVAGLLWLNVADLQRLVFGSSMGWLAGVMIVMFNGNVTGFLNQLPSKSDVLSCACLPAAHRQRLTIHMHFPDNCCLLKVRYPGNGFYPRQRKP